MVLFSEIPEIADFVKQQPFVQDVILLTPDSREQYDELCAQWSQDPGLSEIELARMAGVSSAKVTVTHITEEYKAYGIVQDNPFKLSLSHQAHLWADYIAEKLEEPFILVQPYSFQSSILKAHWRNWEQAIQWLLENSPYKVVIVGQHVTVSGATKVDAPTMEDVFALAERAIGVITTCNSLSHFCKAEKIPAVVVVNECVDESDDVFRRSLNAPNIRMIGFNAPVEYFQKVVSGFPPFQ